MANLNVDYPAYTIEFSTGDFTNSDGTHYARKIIPHSVKGIWEVDYVPRHNQGDLVEGEGSAYFVLNEVFQKLSIAGCRKRPDGNYDLCVCI